MEYKMEELVPIVAELAKKYSGMDSTSLSYEKAQMLMGGVLYCINECRFERAALAEGGLSVKEKYEIGARLVREKAARVRDIYNEMAEYFEDYGVECLHDTVQKGIPEFLNWYDAQFCPQDTILTLDYPILKDIHGLKGVDAVFEFISAVKIEQKFLRKFDRNYVADVLERAVPDYRHMIENVCNVILVNTIGHALIAKPLDSEGFSSEDYEKFYKIFLRKTSSNAENDSDAFSFVNTESMENLLRDIVKEMVKQFYDDDAEMLEYLYCETNNIAVRIRTAAEIGKLDKLFVL